MKQRWMLGMLLTSVVLISGCSSLPFGQKLGESSDLNVPGKGEPGIQKANLNGMEKAFRDQYVAQCTQQMSAMEQAPFETENPKTPDEICTCVADKAWALSKGDPSQHPDPMTINREMMACMGIDADAMQRDMEEQQQKIEEMMAEEQGFMPEEETNRAVRPKEELSDIEQDDLQPAAPVREANRKYKYDPKTGIWSN